MDASKETIGELIKRGKHFTYENFSTKSGYGYPQSFTTDWVTWTARVGGAVKGLFGPDAGPTKLLQTASNVAILGNDTDKFEHARAHYLGALEAALEVLEQDTFGELLKREVATGPHDLTNKVFIVHGHDESAKNELEIMLRDMGLDPIVLHRQADGGRTIIEKFEDHADVGYAFILMTPDEIAYLVSEDAKPDAERKKEFRARPNVIWEFGYFVGRLGRQRTCCIHRGAVSIPSDLNGLIYKPFSSSVEEIGWSIQKELRTLGYVLKS
ncbi:TIR domain-containing protein [Rhizobium leguminosarum]|uniref:TIR domain-containing protein n=1 Tax=Rhizobium leguminosarum TaxID=384 RepID=UPI001FE1027A|nr:nucleotide-binding protein [Rhizobium leguminosarum]